MKQFSLASAVVLLATLLFMATPALAQPRAQRAVQLPLERLTVGAYNVENMFDVFDDPYRSDADPKLRHDMRTVAAAIRELNTDIIGISEVENEYILKAMVDKWLGDMGYKNIVVNMTNSGRGIHLGMISRLPILEIRSYRTRRLTLPGHERTWFFTRDLLHVIADIGYGEELPLHVMKVHFKSKWDSEGDPKSRNWRLAEATEAARIIGRILQKDPDALLVIVGDFNDTRDSATLAAFFDVGLVDMHRDLPEEKQITFLNEPYRSKIDFVLASPALAGRLVEGSAIILDDPQLIAGSDHAPLVACFDLRGLQPPAERP